jgi:anaerobic magnesium-protoporphyrin IX monomethyl ester cyclase
MNIALIEIIHPGDNKDYNGGFGTTFDIGGTPCAWFLKKIRSHYENFPTLSYAYIAAIFKQHKHHVTYYKNKIPEEFDLAIINGTAIRYSEEKNIIQQIKRDKGMIGVFGTLPTTKPELYQEADFIITGEPENAITEIAKTGKIPKGIVKSKYVEDLDTLPFPDWDCFNIKAFTYLPLLKGKPFTFMLRSRGCPFQCSYCPHKILGKFRMRSLNNVLNEMMFLKEKYEIKTVHFRDSYFYLKEDEPEKINKAIRRKFPDIKWGFETRLDALNERMIDVLHDAGLRAIKVGIENANTNRLKQHGRISPDFQHAKKIIKHCSKKGIRTNACYIIGFPDENKKDIQETFQLAKTLSTTFVNFFILTPLPGTRFEEMHSQGVDFKIFDKKWEHRDNFHLIFEHKNFSPLQLKKIQRKAITKYYCRPLYILKYLVNNLISFFKN